MAHVSARQDKVHKLLAMQWMLGDAIMVAPILDQGVVSSSAYLPPGVWYDLYNHTAIDASAAGLNITVQVCRLIPVTDSIHPEINL